MGGGRKFRSTESSVRGRLGGLPVSARRQNAASLKQIRAALSFAYKHWDLKNPFAKIEPPLQNEPQIRYCCCPISAGSSTILTPGVRATAPPSRSA